jgi:hypothetical protein
MRRPLDMRVDQQHRIDPITGLDAEDLFGQVEWCQARGLIHPNDDTPRHRAERRTKEPKP